MSAFHFCSSNGNSSRSRTVCGMSRCLSPQAAQRPALTVQPGCCLSRGTLEGIWLLLLWVARLPALHNQLPAPPHPEATPTSVEVCLLCQGSGPCEPDSGDIREGDGAAKGPFFVWLGARAGFFLCCSFCFHSHRLWTHRAIVASGELSTISRWRSCHLHSRAPSW